MKHKLNDPSQACFLAEIAEKVYGVDPLDTTRTRTNVNARTAISVKMIAAGETYQAIAQFFKKDHTSILYGVKKHPDSMRYDKQYREQYEGFLKESRKPVNKEEYTLAEIKGQVVNINKKLKNLSYKPDEIAEFWKEILN